MGRQHTLTFRLIILSGFSLIACALLASAILPSSAPVNFVRWLAHRFGVSPKEVIGLANELRVDAEKLDQFGSTEFPHNYFVQRLQQIRELNDAVTKEDIEAIVKGYELYCELTPRRVVYLFYSDKPTAPFIGRRALMLDFVYEDDYILQRWNSPNLADSGLEWEKQWIQEKCVGR